MTRSIRSIMGLYLTLYNKKIISSDYNAQVNDHIFIDGTSNINITLPSESSLKQFDKIKISDNTGLLQSTPSTINRNGVNIMSNAENLNLSVNYSTIVLTYIGSTVGWHISVNSGLYNNEVKPFNSTINRNTTLYCATTGSDTTGDGSSGNPWFSIHKALDYLKDKWINNDVTVSISLADGTYDYSSLGTITFNHICGDRIKIFGTTDLPTSYSITASASVDASNDKITIAGDHSTEFPVGSFAFIEGNTGSPLNNGAWKVNGVTYRLQDHAPFKSSHGKLLV